MKRCLCLARIHARAVADFLTCDEVLISWELEQDRLELVVVDLASIIEDGFVCIGRFNTADEVIEAIQFEGVDQGAFNGNPSSMSGAPFSPMV